MIILSKIYAARVTEIHCTYVPEGKSRHDTSSINVKGTIHWVSIKHALKATVNLYDRLFRVENPSAEEGDFKEYINPHSLEVITEAYIEPCLNRALPGDKFQFIRKGYFCVDSASSPGNLIFNRTVQLKDSSSKQQEKK